MRCRAGGGGLIYDYGGPRPTMGGAIGGTAEDDPPKFEVRTVRAFVPPIFWIYEIVVIIINVHSVQTVLFTGLRGSDNC